MIIFRPHKSNNPLSARYKLEKHKETQTCPECKKGKLELQDVGKDRNSYKCKSCKATVIFTGGPKQQKTDKNKRLSLLTVRDRSPQKSKDEKQDSELDPVNKAIMLHTIRKGMTEHTILNFEYIASDGNKSSRSVEPYKLTKNKYGEIILFAYDLEKDSIRVFKLGGMGDIEKQEYTYKPRWDVEDKLVKDAKKT
jgi:hypothetical protein